MEITNSADLAYCIWGQIVILTVLQIATVESVGVIGDTDLDLQLTYRAVKEPNSVEEIEDLLSAVLVCPHVTMRPTLDSPVTIVQLSPYALACTIANKKEPCWSIDNPSFATQILARCERRAESLLAKFFPFTGDHPVEFQYRFWAMPRHRRQALLDKLRAPVLN